MWEVDPETRAKVDRHLALSTGSHNALSVLTASYSSQLHQIQKKDGNSTCCDCGAPSPQWASPKFSTFICLTCAGTHRGLGVHISFVRSISMDAFKQNEVLRMQHGGNKAWQTFYSSNSGGTSFEEATIKERYESEVGEEWKERLSAKVEERDFDQAAWAKERALLLEKQRSSNRAGTPAGGFAGGNQRTATGTNSRSESPASGRGVFPPGQKTKNEAYFARKGEANASRPADLPPNQGGKYGGFGSAPPEPQTTQQGGGGIPSADDFQQDPVAALTKGFGWLSAAVGKTAKTVNDAYIQPTAKNIAASELAAQARQAAAQAGQGIQSGAKNATESISRFVEGQDGRTVTSAGKGAVEPEKKDFWDSFGVPAAAAPQEQPSSIGTTAMRKGAGATSGAVSAGAVGSKAKDDSWGNDW